MTPTAPTSRLWLLLLAALLGIGIYLRIDSFEKMEGVGFDENIYGRYVEQIGKLGWTHYPEVVEMYLTEQKMAPIAFLPPTRVAFLLSAASLRGLTGLPALEAVRATSTIAAVLLLLGSSVFAWRLGGKKLCLVLTALMSFAPLQLYMAHRALIDGFFAMTAFCVIWTLWECLQNSRSKGWLAAYGCSLALMVLTKENAAFVYLALLAILAANRWLKLGEVNKTLMIATALGPLLGAGLLVLAAGGADTLFEAYLLNVRMSYSLPYAIATGDGPWFRYLSDLLLTIPMITLLAIGGIFQSGTKNKTALYFVGFLLVSYLIMGNLRYGMNLRYALIWDFPLCYLAAIPLFAMANFFQDPSRQKTMLTILVFLVVYFQMSNYDTVFIQNAVYDPVPNALNAALKMIK